VNEFVGGHWHTLESARSCPDQCLSPEVIANIEASEARADRGTINPDRCYREEPCPFLNRPAPRCDRPVGVCDELWRGGRYRTTMQHPRSRFAFREHVGTYHHHWWHTNI
jgi:hypothetical protein